MHPFWYVFPSTYGFGIAGNAIFLLACLWIGRRLISYIRVAELDTKVVLVTGCDTGFGRRIALQLSEKYGTKVLAACLTKDAVKELGKIAPGVIVPFQLDVTNEDSMLDALPFIEDHCPLGLHAVINNAGVLRGGFTELAAISDLRLQLNVNVIGIAIVTKHTIPLLREARGRVINVASVAGRFGTTSTSAYNASKFAVEGFSDALRRELKMWDIGVVIIEPGIMKTPLWKVPFSDEEMEKNWNVLTPEQQDMYGADFFEEGRESAKSFVERLGGDPQLVVDVMDRAVTSWWPLHRYGVGIDANLIFLPLSHMPSFIGDKVWSILSPTATPACRK